MYCRLPLYLACLLVAYPSYIETNFPYHLHLLSISSSFLALYLACATSSLLVFLGSCVNGNCDVDTVLEATKIVLGLSIASFVHNQKCSVSFFSWPCHLSSYSVDAASAPSDLLPARGMEHPIIGFIIKVQFSTALNEIPKCFPSSTFFGRKNVLSFCRSVWFF